MNIEYIHPHVKTDLYQAHINAMHHKQKYEIPPSSSAYAIYQKICVLERQYTKDFINNRHNNNNKGKWEQSERNKITFT